MTADPSIDPALREHGRALALRLGLPRDRGDDLADTLGRQYGRWPRRYHDRRHLLACVQAAESLHDAMPEPDAVAFALWFHDAVYRPWRRDNEARSAGQAGASARRLGLGEPFASRVQALVMATAHLDGTAPAHDDAAADWVVDIDLKILGASPAAYDRFEHDVRREYLHVMPWTWRRRRAAVLSHFLSLPRIYRTAHFHDRLEAPARANLQRTLQALQG